ncbi:hypothetical protein [Borrelia persica]|nr:hypothetical protein [Borrelia persica]
MEVVVKDNERVAPIGKNLRKIGARIITEEIGKMQKIKENSNY